MSRVTTAWKYRRIIWKCRRPLWTLWRHRYGVLAATGVAVGFFGAGVVNRTLGR